MREKGSLFLEGFVSEEEYFCTGTQEVLEDRGDMIIGAGVGEGGCCCHRDDVAGQHGCDKSRQRKKRERWTGAGHICEKRWFGRCLPERGEVRKYVIVNM